jgi:CDP-6-deoxy-D-xylo-4-hexulose-3-dehydrase
MVICPVLGNPSYAKQWAKLITPGTYLIEDACESFGAIDSEGKLCGTRGTLSTFSFFYSHQISGIEGGCVLTDDDELADLCRMIRAHGWTRDIKKPERFEDEYDFQIAGAMNMRPLEMHAAVAREQLKKAKQFQQARIENYMRFVTLCAGLPIRFQTSNGILNPFGMAFTMESWEERARLVAVLRANGIDCRLPTGGSFRMHKYAPAYCVNQDTPNADAIHRTGLFLGNAPYKIDDKIEKAVRVMRAFFDMKARAA